MESWTRRDGVERNKFLKSLKQDGNRERLPSTEPESCVSNASFEKDGTVESHGLSGKGLGTS